MAIKTKTKATIKDIQKQTGIEDHTIDLSIGLYMREPHEEASLEAILEEVDRRMYADKRAKCVDDD